MKLSDRAIRALLCVVAILWGAIMLSLIVIVFVGAYRVVHTCR